MISPGSIDCRVFFRVKAFDGYINADRIVEMECYKSMQKIKTIIEDDSLNDEECFIKIEEIVRVFEKLGSNAGDRHDF